MLIAAASTSSGDPQKRDGFLSRLASQATGAVVDINELLDRVDVDELMDRVDVKSLTDRAGIPDIVAESTGALAGPAMDVVRRQIVSLDQIAGRFTYNLIGPDSQTRPNTPRFPSRGARAGLLGDLADLHNPHLRPRVPGHLLGAGIGIVFGWSVVRVPADEGLGAFRIPFGQVLLVLVLAGVAGVLAAIWPARKISRMNILDAITSE